MYVYVCWDLAKQPWVDSRNKKGAAGIFPRPKQGQRAEEKKSELKVVNTYRKYDQYTHNLIILCIIYIVCVYQSLFL